MPFSTSIPLFLTRTPEACTKKVSGLKWETALVDPNGSRAILVALEDYGFNQIGSCHRTKNTHGWLAPLVEKVKRILELIGLPRLQAQTYVYTKTADMLLSMNTGLHSPGCKIQWANTHTHFRGLWVQEETEVGKKCVYDSRRVRDRRFRIPA